MTPPRPTAAANRKSPSGLLRGHLPCEGRLDCRKRCVHPLAPSARGLRPQAVGERTVRLSEIFRAMARFSPSAPSGHRSPSGASATSPVSGESVSQREVFRHAGLPPRGCARRRVSERNRRRRLLARRLKLSPQATDEGKVCHYNPFKGNFRKLAPHPALRATFPRRGRHFTFPNTHTPRPAPRGPRGGRGCTGPAACSRRPQSGRW